MPDRISKEMRSLVMSRIRGRDTGPELRVRRALHKLGFRFRLQRADLPGTPDVVLPKYRVAIFVNGCFWHGHTCKDGKVPKSNSEFWRRKLKRNKERDKKALRALQALGWRVLTVWECQTIDNDALLTLVREKLAG